MTDYTITQTITDIYGNTASYFKLETGNLVGDIDNGDIHAPQYQLRVFKDKASMLAGYPYVDNLTPRVPKMITEAERDAETGSNDVQKTTLAFLRKATVSVLNADSEEINLFDGRVSGVSFVGCGIA